MSRTDLGSWQIAAEGTLRAPQQAWPLDATARMQFAAWQISSGSVAWPGYGYAQPDGTLFPEALDGLLTVAAAAHPGLALLYQGRGHWWQSRTPLLQKLLGACHFAGPVQALRGGITPGWCDAVQTLAALILADGVPVLLLDDLTLRLGEDACAPEACLRYLLLLPIASVSTEGPSHA